MRRDSFDRPQDGVLGQTEFGEIIWRLDDRAGNLLLSGWLAQYQ